VKKAIDKKKEHNRSPTHTTCIPRLKTILV
jgi:hypothetical protein